MKFQTLFNNQDAEVYSNLSLLLYADDTVNFGETAYDKISFSWHLRVSLRFEIKAFEAPVPVVKKWGTLA